MNRTASFLCLVIGLLITAAPSIAQQPYTLWTREYEACGDLRSVQQTPDGGFIALGTGNIGFCLIKTDPDGNEIWSQGYGTQYDEWGLGLDQTSDGGYIMTGAEYWFTGGGYDLMLVKADANGNEEWTYVSPIENNDVGDCVRETTDGGFIISGYRWIEEQGNYDLWLVKTDNLGTLQWEKSYGGHNWERGNAVEQLDDGGYIVAGYTWSYGNGGHDVYLLRADAQGDTLWTQTFGGPENDHAYDVKETEDGGFILAGDTFSSGDTWYDALLLKTDSNGDLEWYHTYGQYPTDHFSGVQLTDDGGYILAGTSGTDETVHDVWVVKTDALGSEQWSTLIGEHGHEYSYDIAVTSDGNFIIAGEASRGLLVKLATEAPSLAIMIAPVNPPIIIPSQGGGFFFDGIVENTGLQTVEFDVWTEVEWHTGGSFYPVIRRRNLFLSAGGQIEGTITQEVPFWLPVGQYIYRGYVGNYPDVMIDSSEFQFEKLSPQGPPEVEDWDVSPVQAQR
jgi:hypothetical protein